MLFAILTIVGGLIAASSLIIAKTPNSRQLFDKIAPYQGFLGVGLLGFGLFHLIFRVMPNFGVLMQVPLTGGLLIAGLALDILIGFLLGYGLVSRWLSRSNTAAAKGQAALAKLVPVQVPMGLAAVCVGVLLLIGF